MGDVPICASLRGAVETKSEHGDVAIPPRWNVIDRVAHNEPRCAAPRRVHLTSRCAFHREGIVYLLVGRLHADPQRRRFSSR